MGKCRKSKGLAAAVLALALLAGCAGTGQEPGVEPPAGQSAPEGPALDGERLAVLEEAEERLKGYLWPRETVVKDILGQEMEFVLYHGNGWTIHVPTSWESEGVYSGIWSAPSHNAGFQVGKQFLGVNNPKWYRAQTGSWRHETDYDPPFDYYYDNDGGYTPPEGSADYIYFFAPDGDDRSYEFTLSLVVGETTQEERAIQEAMLLSFRLDDSSHVLYSGDYTPGRTQWESAAAGLLAESEPVRFFWSQDGQSYDLAGKASPDYPTPWRWRITSRESLSRPFLGRVQRAARLRRREMKSSPSSFLSWGFGCTSMKTPPGCASITPARTTGRSSAARTARTS